MDEELKNDIKELQNQARFYKDIGKDFLKLGQIMENYIDKSTNPIEQIFNNNLKMDLDVLQTEMQLHVAILTNKSNVFLEYLKDFMGDKGEE